MTDEETFDLVVGELDGEGSLVSVLVVAEGLSREQAAVALEVQRSTQLRAGRTPDVTECDGESFDLLNPRGKCYRRYFLQRVG